MQVEVNIMFVKNVDQGKAAWFIFPLMGTNTIRHWDAAD